MPRSIDANSNLSAAINQLVPGWHIPMMNDARRNEAYVAALTAAVTAETDVFEIGLKILVDPSASDGLKGRSLGHYQVEQLIGKQSLRSLQ